MDTWLITTLDATGQPLASGLAVDPAGRLHAMFSRYLDYDVRYIGAFAGWKPTQAITRVTPFQ